MNAHRLLFIFLVFFITPLPVAAAEKETLRKEESGWRIVNSRTCDGILSSLQGLGFVKHRGLTDYKSFFGPGFMNEVIKLSKLENAHWIDSGTGNMTAQQNYILSGYKKFYNFNLPEKKARVTGIGPDTVKWISEVEPRIGTNATHLHGLLNEFSDKEIGKADLITDLYGAAAYTRDLSYVLNRYAALIKKNGVIYLHIYNGERTLIDGMTPLKWLKTLKGIEVSEVGIGSIRMKIVNPAFRIPQLTLIRFVKAAPPIREFQFVSHLGQ